MTLEEIRKQQNCIIIGAAREGQSCAQFLRSMAPDVQITLADTQEISVDIEGVELRMNEQYPESLAPWDMVVVSPGIPPTTPLLKTAKTITTATNIFMANCVGTVIGVTGSKGKSTTTSLIHHILKTAGKPAHLVGNIGIPALGELEKHNTTDDIFVYEMSSFQISRLEKAPDYAIITNLFPVHMDYHGGIEEYYEDKLRITRLQRAGQTVAFNIRNHELHERMKNGQATELPWPHRDGAHVEDHEIHFNGEVIMAINEIPLLGDHNVSNVLGAITIAKAFGVGNEVLADAIKSFASLPHRLQFVVEKDDIRYINDSISTAPESAIAALNAIPKVGALIIGGVDRGFTFEHLAHAVKQSGLHTLVVFPDTGAGIKQALVEIDALPEHTYDAASMQEAVELANEHIQKGEAVVLSPAAPSFNMFKNFEDRGEQYIAAVNAL